MRLRVTVTSCCLTAAGDGHAAAGDEIVDGDGGGGDGDRTGDSGDHGGAAVEAKELATLAVARAVLSGVGEAGMASS